MFPNNIQEKLNLKTATIQQLLYYYFYKNNTEGFVLRYGEEQNDLFGGFTFKKSYEDKYEKKFKIKNKQKINTHSSCWIEESVNQQNFSYIMEEVIQELPDINIQKRGKLFIVLIKNERYEEASVLDLLFRATMISQYGCEVDFIKLQLDVEDYDQVFPSIGKYHDTYQHEDN